MFYSCELHSLNIVEYPFTSSAAIKWQNNDQDAERFILWFVVAGEQCKGILFCTFAAVQLENCVPAIDGKRSGVYYKMGDEKQQTTRCNYLNSSGFLWSSLFQVRHLVNSKFHILTMLFMPQRFFFNFFLLSCFTNFR